MWRQYIFSDKQILLGKPTIKGTRISVELILELFQNGRSEQRILESHPNITQEALRAVFTYLKECVQNERNPLLSTSASEPRRRPREGWSEAFKEMHQNGDDELLMPDVFEDEFPESKGN